ncbi:MAG: hypothetical protein IPP32_00170 [Bacteroidetes bacterium]|nr:hypothetical protein [Bacteroidota bacterium]
MEAKYPVYRKYEHNRTFFKVLSKDEFEELQIIGHHYSIHLIKAKILPDRNFIYDLTFDFKLHWLEIKEAEYSTVLANCEKNLKRLA